MKPLNVFFAILLLAQVLVVPWQLRLGGIALTRYGPVFAPAGEDINAVRLFTQLVGTGLVWWVVTRIVNRHTKGSHAAVRSE